jgi:broad specificity phosphatase PhoE
MLKIYLARHGQDKDNASGILNGRRDESLSDKGIEQANEVAGKIKATGIHFDHVYSSPLQRAYKTAEIITDTLGINKPEVLEDLIERDFGIMTGKLQSTIKDVCAPDIMQTDTICYFLSPEGAETFPQLIERARKVLGEVKAKHKDGNILLVTHGDFGKMIYTAYYDLDWKDVLKMFHFGNSELLELSEESGPEETHVFKIQQHNS